MKCLRLLLSATLIGAPSLALTQTVDHSTVDHSTMAAAPAAQTDAQKSFTQLKALAGSWQGIVTSTPTAPEVQGKQVRLSLRVTSMGNALMHEMRVGDRPDDPITMLYLDGDRLMLTHFCDAGNRPRMVARVSPDGGSIDFDIVDVAGPLTYGHMQHALFTFIDATHHTEDWTYMGPGNHPVRAHFDLHRAD